MSRKDLVAVKVDRDTYEMLRDYKEKTGVTIVFTIGKAVEQYFKGRETE